MQPADIAADEICPVFAHMMLPTQVEIDTHIQNLAPVACYRRFLHRQLRRDHRVLRQAVVPVDITGQAVA